MDGSQGVDALEAAAQGESPNSATSQTREDCQAHYPDRPGSVGCGTDDVCSQGETAGGEMQWK